MNLRHPLTELPLLSLIHLLPLTHDRQTLSPHTLSFLKATLAGGLSPSLVIAASVISFPHSPHLSTGAVTKKKLLNEPLRQSRIWSRIWNRIQIQSK